MIIFPRRMDIWIIHCHRFLLALIFVLLTSLKWSRFVTLKKKGSPYFRASRSLARSHNDAASATALGFLLHLFRRIGIPIGISICIRAVHIGSSNRLHRLHLALLRRSRARMRAFVRLILNFRHSRIGTGARSTLARALSIAAQWPFVLLLLLLLLFIIAVLRLFEVGRSREGVLVERSELLVVYVPELPFLLPLFLL